MQYVASASEALCGDIRVPGDKSISHRAIMLGALAQGDTHVSGLLEGDDVLATIAAFRAMGVVIDGPKAGKVMVHGMGLHGLKAPSGALYLGNAGTAMRLLAGVLAGQSFSATLTGDSSLTKRPMERVAVPLRLMGGDVRTSVSGCPPLVIRGNTHLKAMHYTLPMASAQVKSCLLFAGLYAQGETMVTEPAPTRDHTERMLQGFGYALGIEGSTVRLTGGGELIATTIDVPGDISSAAFFMVAASIVPGSDLVLRHVGMNPTRVGVIRILQAMGADIHCCHEKIVGGEPVADIRVRAAPLHGITIPAEQVPLAIDEFPALFVAAAYAAGTTILNGAKELRFKESDRLSVMAQGLSRLGADARATDDGMVIHGGVSLHGGEIDSCHDHRIAMAFAIAALRAKEPVVIHGCEAVATSFPNFVELARRVGMNIQVITQHD